MNMKHLPVLAVILIVVIGIIIVANQLSNRQPSEKSLAFFPQFSPVECGIITVSDSHDTASLVRHGAVWMVAAGRTGQNATASPLVASDTVQKTKGSSEYPADSSLIQTALDKLKTMKKDDIISENPAKQAELEVDTIHGLRVDLANDKGAAFATFYLGKNGADWSSTFVRMKGSNDVYLVGGSVKYSFFADKNRWKDKSIVKVDRAFAKAVTIAKADTVIQLALTAPSPKDSAAKPAWLIVSPVKDTAKGPEIDKIFNTLSSLPAMEFEDAALSDDSMGFAKPYCTVAVSMENGDKKTVIIGKQKAADGRRWVRTPDKNATFLIPKYSVDNLDRSINGLKGIEEKKPETRQAPAKGPAKPTKKEKKKTAAKN
jgi:Domain of unknown function (DUF4340)